MTLTPFSVETQLTGTPTEDTVYTAPTGSGETATISEIVLTNGSGSAVTVTVRRGDSGTEKTWRKAIAIAAGKTVTFYGAAQLEASQVLKMEASAASAIDVLVSGLERTA
jgi:hypothetical protein